MPSKRKRITKRQRVQLEQQRQQFELLEEVELGDEDEDEEKKEGKGETKREFSATIHSNETHNINNNSTTVINVFPNQALEWLCRELAEIKKGNSDTAMKIDKLTSKLNNAKKKRNVKEVKQIENDPTGERWKRFVKQEIAIFPIPALEAGRKRRAKGAVKKTLHTDAWEAYKRFCERDDNGSNSTGSFEEFKSKMMQWMTLEYSELALENQDPKLGMVHDSQRNKRGPGFAGIQIRSLMAEQQKELQKKIKNKKRKIA